MIKTLILAACLALGLAACAQNAEQARFSHAGALSFEAGVRARCPRSQIELGVLLGIRMAYDAALAPVETAGQAGELKADRDRTNAACGIVITTRPAPPPPPPEPAAGTPQI